jgi:hypothetical protein
MTKASDSTRTQILEDCNDGLAGFHPPQKHGAPQLSSKFETRRIVLGAKNYLTVDVLDCLFWGA